MRHALRLPTARRLALLAGLTLLLGGLAALASRAGDLDEAAPLSRAEPDPALRDLIRDFEAGGRTSGLSLMSFWGPNEQPVYLVTAPCCDRFNPLYDREGRRICAPTGGFSGAGDGTCPAWVGAPGFWRKIRLPGGARAQAPWPPASGG